MLDVFQNDTSVLNYFQPLCDITSLCDAQSQLTCGFQNQKPLPDKPKDSIILALLPLLQFIFKLYFAFSIGGLVPRLVTVHDSFHTENRSMLFKRSIHLLTIVQLCCWLCNHLCTNCDTVDFFIFYFFPHIFFPPFEECLDVGTLKRTP